MRLCLLAGLLCLLRLLGSSLRLVQQGQDIAAHTLGLSQRRRQAPRQLGRQLQGLCLKWRDQIVQGFGLHAQRIQLLNASVQCLGRGRRRERCEPSRLAAQA